MAEGGGMEGGTHRWGSTYPPGAGQCQGGQGLLSGKTCLCLEPSCAQSHGLPLQPRHASQHSHGWALHR